MFIRQLSIKDGIFFHKYRFVEKNTIFNGQLMNVHKRLMCYEAPVVGLKLSEDGLNTHRNTLKHELITSDGKRFVVHDIW